ncbi:MAG: hypothetical protein EAZ95_14715, partial [Bacteroidetes bacterium]
MGRDKQNACASAYAKVGRFSEVSTSEMLAPVGGTIFWGNLWRLYAQNRKVVDSLLLASAQA